MSQGKNLTIQELIVYMAEYHGKEISEPVVRMFSADLKGFTVPEVYKAWEIYRTKPSNIWMPQPSQLKAIARPEYDTENVPRMLAEKLVSAVSDKGSYWLNNSENPKQELMDYFGPLACKVIEKMGGWSRVCQSINSSNSLENFKAQARNLIKSVMELSMAGHIDTKFSLPESKNKSKDKLESVPLSKLLPGA